VRGGRARARPPRCRRGAGGEGETDGELRAAAAPGLWASTVPPWSSTKPRTSARPSPRPPVARASGWGACSNGSGLGLGHLEDGADEPRHLSRPGGEREVAAQPVALHAGRLGRRAVQLDPEDRLAALEDRPVDLHEAGREVRHDLEHALAEVVLGREAVDLGHPLVDPAEPVLAVEGEQPDGRVPVDLLELGVAIQRPRLAPAQRLLRPPELRVGRREGRLAALVLVHVRAGADPADERAAVAAGEGADEEPAERAVGGAAEPVLDLVRRTGRDALLPPRRGALRPARRTRGRARRSSCWAGA